MPKITVALALLTALIVSFMNQAQAIPADVPGGKDHPLLTRYAGSRLIAWRKSTFADVKPLQMLTEDIAKGKNWT